jgi:hypothetical protein
LDEEAARNLMVSFVTGTCSPAEKHDFEAHYLSCDECLTKLAVILQILRSPISKEEENTLPPLYTISMEAASVARSEAKIEVPKAA